MNTDHDEVARDSVERRVAEEVERLWRQVLQAPSQRDCSEGSFFAQGGSSLQAVALAACLQARLDVEVTVLTIVDYPTLTALTHHVAELCAQAHVEGDSEEGLL